MKYKLLSMFSNRISYEFDFEDPICRVNPARSGSDYGLDFVFKSIRSSKFQAAIMAAGNLIMKSQVTKELSMLNQDKKSHPFDCDANGLVKSEAAIVVCLQKSRNFKRIHAKISVMQIDGDGYEEEAVVCSSGRMQGKLMRQLHGNIDLDALEVTYTEAHITETEVCDSQESNNIVNILSGNRQGPMLISSVESYVKHEKMTPALRKLLAIEMELIPFIIKLKTTNTGIPGLISDRLNVSEVNEPLTGGIATMNSFGFARANGRLVFASNYKSRAPTAKAFTPRIIEASSRIEEAESGFLDSVEHKKIVLEFLTSNNTIHHLDIRGHNMRGFSIPADNNVKQLGACHIRNRPIWFVYSGMGTQWAGMAKDMMNIEVFARTIKECADVLQHRDVDLVHILTKADSTFCYRVTDSLVAIAAMQIALTNVLLSLGITPDGIVAHSAGEAAAAYTDGCLTLQQVMEISYLRGHCLATADLPEGAMAAVKLSFEETKWRLPPDLYPVCDNSDDNTTVAGPPGSVRKLVEELSAKGILARVLATARYALHSRYVEPSASQMLADLKEIILEPKLRSKKWVSSAIPEKDWGTRLSLYASAEYYVNSLMSPVYFKQAIKHVPEDAIIIEIAPTGSLQPMLRSGTSVKATNLSLMERDHPDNIEFFLSALRRIHIAGGQPKFNALH